MSHTIYLADFITNADGETLRNEVDKVKHGFIYNAQDLVDTLETDGLWREGTHKDFFHLKDETPSPVMYKGEKYEFLDVWNDGEKNPFAFIMVKSRKK